jgi:hypothetical protein
MQSRSLRGKLSSQNISETQALYEQQYTSLTEKYFKDDYWPPAEVIAPLVKSDVRYVMH